MERADSIGPKEPKEKGPEKSHVLICQPALLPQYPEVSDDPEDENIGPHQQHRVPACMQEVVRSADVDDDSQAAVRDTGPVLTLPTAPLEYKYAALQGTKPSSVDNTAVYCECHCQLTIQHC
eukprot:1138531-Pelagomonas_calceolata.AAC.12